MVYSFKAQVAARGFHVYRNIARTAVKQGDSVWVEIETNEESKKVDPYSCGIKALVGQPPQLKTVGHIPREISRHVFFFLKEENGRIKGTVHSTKYQPSPIPAGGLEIPLKLTFKSTRFATHRKMKDFMTSLYSYEYKPQEINSKDEENYDINFIIEQDEDEEDSEVVLKPKKRKKPPIISETSSESSENKICSEHSEFSDKVQTIAHKQQIGKKTYICLSIYQFGTVLISNLTMTL